MKRHTIWNPIIMISFSTRHTAVSWTCLLTRRDLQQFSKIRVHVSITPGSGFESVFMDHGENIHFRLILTTYGECWYPVANAHSITVSLPADNTSTDSTYCIQWNDLRRLSKKTKTNCNDNRRLNYTTILEVRRYLHMYMHNTSEHHMNPPRPDIHTLTW